MLNLDERIVQMLHQERLDKAERERLVDAIRRARRPAAHSTLGAESRRGIGHWFARRKVTESALDPESALLPLVATPRPR